MPAAGGAPVARHRRTRQRSNARPDKLVDSAGYCAFALEYGNRGTGDIPISAGQLARFVDAVLAAPARTRSRFIETRYDKIVTAYSSAFMAGAPRP